MPIDQFQQLLLVYAVYLIAVASPGPSTMAIMRTAMGQGRGPAIVLALGVVTGSMTWAALAATGISTVLAAWAPAIFVIRIAGGLYLLWLAWKSARSALTPTAPQVQAASGAPAITMYRKGVLLHLTNPKTILGWIAIMSLGLQQDSAPGTMAAILGGCAILGLAMNVGYALLFSTRVMRRIWQKSRRWIEGILTAIFGYGGIRLLLSKP
jgi:Putative threonine efflux protein